MVPIPQGIDVQVVPGHIVVKGPKAELTRSYNPLYCTVRLEGSNLVVEPRGRTTRATAAAVGSIEAHVRNMLKGTASEYEKKLTIVYAHFPMSIEVKGDTVFIKNFLGEKVPRQSRIMGKSKVTVSGSDVLVRGSDKEAVSQTASNLVRAARPHRKDIRVFQDGIYWVRS